MLERILVVSGINGNELLKSMSLNGQNTIGLRIVSPAELAQMSLLRAGIVIKETLVPTSEERLWMRDVMNKQNPTFKDVRSMTQAIHMLQRLAVGENEEAEIRERLGKGIFKNKNEKLLENYAAYRKLLAERGCVDTTDIIRKALTEGSTWETEFLTLSEMPLDPLSSALVQKLSGGKCREIGVCELYGHTNPLMPTSVRKIRDCYGASAEVDTVLREIYESGKLDACTIAVTDASYAQLLYDQALCYEIPVTFACGVSIQNTAPAKLLVRYYNWRQTGFGQDALSEMLDDPCFDFEKFSSLWKSAGDERKILETVLRNVRLGTDIEENARKLIDLKKSLDEQNNMMDPESHDYEELQKKILCLPFLENIAKELALPSYAFIRKYTRIRQEKTPAKRVLITELDKAAVGMVCRNLELLEKAGVSSEDVYVYIMSLSVADGSSLPGFVHVVTVENAFETMRKNLYVVGLSSLKFPGEPKENHLLLDDDLMRFDNAEMYLADEKVLRRKDTFDRLISLQHALGGAVVFSFAGMNVAELKTENPSSVLLEFDNTIETIGYFDNRLSRDGKVGENYLKPNVQLVSSGKDSEYTAFNSEAAFARSYSPSALEMFFQCPRRFFLQYLCGIQEPDEKDPYEVISRSDRGTLAHMLMERLAESPMSEEDFMDLSEKAFENFMKEHPPVAPTEEEKNNFLAMMKKAYALDAQNKGEIVFKEETLECVHSETGITLKGRPDRVERRGDNEFWVVDYKTKRTIEHKKDDVDTCLQNVLYAYMLSQNGNAVRGTEYWYFEKNRKISCSFDGEIMERLDEKMEIFATALRNGQFPISEDKEKACKYCKYGRICGKPVEEV